MDNNLSVKSRFADARLDRVTVRLETLWPVMSRDLFRRWAATSSSLMPDSHRTVKDYGFEFRFDHSYCLACHKLLLTPVMNHLRHWAVPNFCDHCQPAN